MARVVEAAVTDFSETVRVEKIVTRTREGAERYRQIVTALKRQVAVPSILINGEPVFEQTPGVDELQQTLRQMEKNLGVSGKNGK